MERAPTSQFVNSAMVNLLGSYFTPGIRYIDEYRLAAPAASVIFATIPQFYRELQVSMKIRSTRAAPNESDSVGIQFNADAGNRYHWGYLQRSGGAFTSGEFLNAAAISIGVTEAGGSTAGFFSSVKFSVINYAAAAVAHYAQGESTAWGNQSVAADYILSYRSGNWTPVGAQAITSLTVFCLNGNIDTGSIIRFSP